MNLDILGQKYCFQTLSQHSSSPLNMHMLVLSGCNKRKGVDVAYKIFKLQCLEFIYKTYAFFQQFYDNCSKELNSFL